MGVISKNKKEKKSENKLKTKKGKEKRKGMITDGGKLIELACFITEILRIYE